MTIGQLRVIPYRRRPGRWSLDLGTLLQTAAATGSAALLGVAIAAGSVSLLAAGAALIVLWLAVIGRRITAAFLGTTAVLVIGYAFLGRGLAHVGFGPIYVGEIALFMAVPATLLRLRHAHLSWVHVFLGLFMAWGAIRTLPYIDQYGIAALRDSVTWSYGFFAIAVSLTLEARHIPRLIRGFRRLVVPFVIWVPVGTILSVTVSDRIPVAPGSDVPLIFVKTGDAGVFLAAIAAFILTGLYASGRARNAVREAVVWICWLVSFVFVAAISRGGMVAAGMAAFSGLTIRRFGRWLMPVALGTILLTGAWLANPQVDLGLIRNVSVDQLVGNVTSIFTNQNGTETNDTKEWRLAWWNKIIGYTIDGPYFWSGKGYGINLADSDGFQVNSDDSLRAPHSTHLEILARSGVPGLVSWVALQGVFAATMVVALVRAYRRRSTVLLAVITCVTVYWMAALVNSSFDVYLGGPQGGIPFWCDIGVGIVLSRMARQGTIIEADESAVPPALG